MRFPNGEICLFLLLVRFISRKDFFFFLPIIWSCLIKSGHNVTHVLVTKNNQWRSVRSRWTSENINGRLCIFFFFLFLFPSVYSLVLSFFSFVRSFVYIYREKYIEQLVRHCDRSYVEEEGKKRRRKKNEKRMDSSVKNTRERKRRDIEREKNELSIHHYFYYSV